MLTKMTTYLVLVDDLHLSGGLLAKLAALVHQAGRQSLRHLIPPERGSSVHSRKNRAHSPPGNLYYFWSKVWTFGKILNCRYQYDRTIHDRKNGSILLIDADTMFLP